MDSQEIMFAKALRAEFENVDKWLADPQNNVDFFFDYQRTFREYMEEYWDGEFSLYYIAYDLDYPESQKIYDLYEKFWELKTPDIWTLG